MKKIPNCCKPKEVIEMDSTYKMSEELEKKRKKHPIYYFLYGLYWRVYRFVSKIPLEVRTFIQRGRKGWSTRDTWSFDYYLAKVISEGVLHIKKYASGYPSGLSEVQWTDILNKISNTFEVYRRISEGNLYLIKDKEHKEKWQTRLNEINKKHNRYGRCMTTKEILKYEEGWKLFKEYFFDLWD